MSDKFFEITRLMFVAFMGLCLCSTFAAVVVVVWREALK